MIARRALFSAGLAWFANQFKVLSAPAQLGDTLPATLDLFIGGETKEVKLFQFDTAQMTFTMMSKSDALGPSAIWLAFDNSKKFLLSTSASNFENKEKTGGVFSASIAADGSLTKVSSSASPEAPVSLEVSHDGNVVFVAAYNGGSLSSYQLSADGKLSQNVQTFKFQGSGPDKDRQASASAHQVKLDPSGQLLLVPDLGSDRVHSFAVSANGTLTPINNLKIKSGCGPRHLEYAPETKTPLRFYLVCELSSEVLLIELPDQKAKTATVKQTISALPQGIDPKTFNAAEILITPDGKFLYVTNRQKDPAGRIDDNMFAVFSRNPANAQLRSAGFFPTGGKGPRHFAFSPDKAASLIVVTNQDSNLVTIHRRNATSGALTNCASVPSESPAVALFRV